jgi:hypothetical protein
VTIGTVKAIALRLGKHQSQVARVLHGLMGAVGFRITFQAPADVLFIS